MFATMRKARPAAAAVFVSMFLVACGDDDDPAAIAFNAETAGEFATAGEDALAPALASFEAAEVITTAFATLGGTVPMAPALPLELASRATARGVLDRTSISRSVALSPAAPGALIPDELEGTTFVWDVDQAGYVASDRTGAPANGVRFVYYEMDGSVPAQPLVERGRLDLVDASTTSMARLEIELVQDAGNVRLADYFVQASVVSNLSTTTATMSSEGFVSDGESRADFDMDMVQTQSATSFGDDATIVIENEDAGARIVLDYEFLDGVSGVVESGELSIENGSDEAVFRYESEGDEELSTLDGELLFNGDQVVVFSGEGDEEVEFTRPDGSALTQAEVEAMMRMWFVYVFTALFSYSVLLPFLALIAPS